MDFYHGTSIGGLKELMPFASTKSNLAEPCVYLTTRKQVALHYIGNWRELPFSSPMLDIREEALVFQEMYSGALELSYKGVNGYIYHCVGNYAMSENDGVRTCAVSYEPVPITDVEYIDDVYEKIMEYEKQGKFIYEKYEDLPQYRHDIIRGYVIRTIKSENLLNNRQHPHYFLFQEKFSKYWKEAEVLYKNRLL